MNIRKIILEEIDDWDFVRDTASTLPFNEWKLGETYEVYTINDSLYTALSGCEWGPIDVLKERFKYIKYITIRSDVQNQHVGWVDCSGDKTPTDVVYIRFLNDYKDGVDSFWVMEGQIEVTSLK